MIKLDQRGFTLVELLVSIGILAIVAPLLATGMFQILTSTERGRAGFEAQADTRNAAAWMSQDIVMAQAAYPDYADLCCPPWDDGTPVPNLSCRNDFETFVTFTWTDWFGDSALDHTVSYCIATLSGDFKGTELLRIYDCGEPIVIGRQMDLVKFEIFEPSDPDSLAGSYVEITIRSDPARNRFRLFDEKTVRVRMRSMPASDMPPPCNE